MTTTPTLETELRATIQRHALMAALINANMVLNAIARECRDAEDERRERRVQRSIGEKDCDRNDS